MTQRAPSFSSPQNMADAADRNRFRPQGYRPAPPPYAEPHANPRSYPPYQAGVEPRPAVQPRNRAEARPAMQAQNHIEYRPGMQAPPRVQPRPAMQTPPRFGAGAEPRPAAQPQNRTQTPPAPPHAQPQPAMRAQSYSGVKGQPQPDIQTRPDVQPHSAMQSQPDVQPRSAKQSQPDVQPRPRPGMQASRPVYGTQPPFQNSHSGFQEADFRRPQAPYPAWDYPQPSGKVRQPVQGQAPLVEELPEDGNTAYLPYHAGRLIQNSLYQKPKENPWLKWLPTILSAIVFLICLFLLFKLIQS